MYRIKTDIRSSRSEGASVNKAVAVSPSGQANIVALSNEIRSSEDLFLVALTSMEVC